MIELILEKVINTMLPHLDSGQMEQLHNALYINFHGVEVREECYEVAETGIDGDALKVKMFVASKKAVNRQENTLKQYTTEICKMLDFLGKRIEDITAMDLRYYYGVMREMGRQELIVFGKGSKERKVYLTDNARFYLKRYLKERMKEEGITEEELVNKPLFATLDQPHARLTVAGIQYMFRQLGRRAGVKKVHPHRFRRTIATDLLNRGMPVEQVSKLLGHEKLDTTMIYCTVQEENVKESHRKFA